MSWQATGFDFIAWDDKANDGLAIQENLWKWACGFAAVSLDVLF
jgi:hypothetical protein